MVTVDDGLQLGREVVVEDAVIPRALARILRPGLALASLVADKGKHDRPIRWSEILLGVFRNPYRGPSGPDSDLPRHEPRRAGRAARP